MFFSVIIPVYNRPQEINELLDSLVKQDYKQFEVIIVEDGSEVSCKHIVDTFIDQLEVQYYFQDNSGQGFARNFGMKKAKGDYFVLFDSDCVIPVSYFKKLKEAIVSRKLDAHGGPDAAASDFSDFQKAINFSMTSFWTTGGIRGKVVDPKKYQARGYNMGLSKEVFEKTQGFLDANKGEDIELSIRIKDKGYNLELVRETYVYHKRRNDFNSFLKQSYSFGGNRVNVNRYHPGSIKLVHLMPMFFLFALIITATSSMFFLPLFQLGTTIFGLWTFGVFVSSTIHNSSVFVGVISIFTSYGQLLAYGLGLLVQLLKR
ncbi:glycosyltransferase family 2 protein [Echinicola sp. 20G]|uniref:glycosyltransferase n=1 Tax=Echinicola sp. 20G TaxID=2781961 RepID=UPI001910BF14|nr:glycosyltransferase [Echinicola sp. 20G]